MGFKEEATILVKDIIYAWSNNDFNMAVELLEDYLTDQDTKYQGQLAALMESKNEY